MDKIGGWVLNKSFRLLFADTQDGNVGCIRVRKTPFTMNLISFTGI